LDAVASIQEIMFSDFIEPSGDDLATQAFQDVRRQREMCLPVFSTRTLHALKQQVCLILSQTPQAKSILSECFFYHLTGKEIIIISCPNETEARFLRTLYLETIDIYGDWRTLPEVLRFTWAGCYKPLQAPYIFAANYPATIPEATLQAIETGDFNGEITPPERSVMDLLQFTPQSKEEEPFARMHESEKPATILSMRNEQVIAANLRVVGFCQESLDEIVGYNVRQLFEMEQNHPRYQPTDLTAFHETLKQQKVFEGEIFSWRSTRIFARYPIRAEHHIIAGLNCRLTFFDPVEIIA
jgi:hypothetical protein